MTTRQAKRRPPSFVQLPLFGAVALYARVTPREELAQGEPGEVAQLQRAARERGFPQGSITVFCDEGEAADAPLNEREGYTALLKAIAQGSINVLSSALQTVSLTTQPSRR
jgi:DNA invertase Pin-like site-specific DNA recombinase